MTKYRPELDPTMSVLAKGERGALPQRGTQSKAGPPWMGFPSLPPGLVTAGESGGVTVSGESSVVDTPSRETVFAWAQELATLSPAAYEKILKKFGVEAGEDIDDDNFREYAIAIRTALDTAKEMLRESVAKNVSRAKR